MVSKKISRKNSSVSSFFFSLSSSDAKTCPCQLDEVCHQNDSGKGKRNMAVIISENFLFASLSKKRHKIFHAIAFLLSLDS